MSMPTASWPLHPLPHSDKLRRGENHPVEYEYKSFPIPSQPPRRLWGPSGAAFGGLPFPKAVPVGREAAEGASLPRASHACQVQGKPQRF